jgi:hypothetical protein
MRFGGSRRRAASARGNRIVLASLQMITSLFHRLKICSASLSPDAQQKFAVAAKRRLRDADPAFRRIWLHIFVDRVTIGPDQIVIRGPEEPLLSIIERGGEQLGAEVPKYAREWRALRDSNS